MYYFKYPEMLLKNTGTASMLISNLSHIVAENAFLLFCLFFPQKYCFSICLLIFSQTGSSIQTTECSKN